MVGKDDDLLKNLEPLLHGRQLSGVIREALRLYFGGSSSGQIGYQTTDGQAGPNGTGQHALSDSLDGVLDLLMGNITAGGLPTAK